MRASTRGQEEHQKLLNVRRHLNARKADGEDVQPLIRENERRIRDSRAAGNRVRGVNNNNVRTPNKKAANNKKLGIHTKITRQDMYRYLIEMNGVICQGCDREFDDERYLQLDHITPRADGGTDHISNRTLLCGPCNQAKGSTYTLSGLRKLNKKKGWMKKPEM